MSDSSFFFFLLILIDVTICSVLVQAKASNQTWGANSNKWWRTGEGTACDWLQRGASNIWGSSKSVTGCWEILYTVLLNYYQPQRRIHRKFYQWKFRNETSFRFKSFWAFEQSLYGSKVLHATCQYENSYWNVNSWNGKHLMSHGDWLWCFSVPVIQKTWDESIVGASMQATDYGPTAGCFAPGPHEGPGLTASRHNICWDVKWQLVINLVTSSSLWSLERSED